MTNNDEIKRIAEDYGIDMEEAETLRDISDEYGVDEDDALELLEAGI